MADEKDQSKKRESPTLQIFKKGELYKGPIPTRWTMPHTDEALKRKCREVIEEAQARLEQKTQDNP
jgi:hypothetical protein